MMGHARGAWCWHGRYPSYRRALGCPHGTATALGAPSGSGRARSKELVLNEKTVETHISTIFTKLTFLPQPEDHRRVLAVLA